MMKKMLALLMMLCMLLPACAMAVSKHTLTADDFKVEISDITYGAGGNGIRVTPKDNSLGLTEEDINWVYRSVNQGEFSSIGGWIVPGTYEFGIWVNEGVNWYAAGSRANPLRKDSWVFTVHPAPLSKNSLTVDPESSTYTGKAIMPEVELVQDGGSLLVEGMDYKLSFLKDGKPVTEMIEVGTYTVKAEGKGNYCGEQTVTFEIVAVQEPGSGGSGGESGGGSSGESGSSSSGSSGGIPPEQNALFTVIDDISSDSGCTDENGGKLLSRVTWLKGMSQELQGTPFDTIGSIIEELERQIDASGFAPEGYDLCEAELGKNSNGQWEMASDEAHAKAGRVHMRAMLRGEVDLTNCDFMIVHMFAHGARAGEVEFIRDCKIRRLEEPGMYELSFVMTGMSPIAICAREKAPAADLPETGDPSSLLGWVCLLGAAGAGMKLRGKKR